MNTIHPEEWCMAFAYANIVRICERLAYTNRSHLRTITDRSTVPLLTLTGSRKLSKITLGILPCPTWEPTASFWQVGWGTEGSD